MGFSPAGGSISGADDVAISNAADNQVLTYDSSTQLWRNEAVASGGVILPWVVICPVLPAMLSL